MVKKILFTPLLHTLCLFYSLWFKRFFLITFGFSICFFVYAQHTNYHYQYEAVKIDSNFDAGADLTLETYMYHLKQAKDKKMNQVIGISKEAITSFSPMSLLSNLLVDMLFEWGNNYLIQKKLGQADLALLNFGGIRAALPQGDITIGDLFQISPFDNTVTFVFVRGSELKKMFDSFNEKRNAPMANVQTIYQNGRLISYTIGGEPLKSEKIYTVVTVNFLAMGGDAILNPVLQESATYLDIQVRDVFIDEIRKKTAQGIEIEGTKDDRVIIRATP